MSKRDEFVLMDFTKLSSNNRGFLLKFNEEGSPNNPDDKYHLYLHDDGEDIFLIALREDECILLNALLSFGVHKKIVMDERWKT